MTKPIMHPEFVGRHLLVDASTSSRRNLASPDTTYTLFEALARNLDMTQIIPPIVCQFPFASNELHSFTSHVEEELARKIAALKEKHPDAVLDLDVISIMKKHLKKRQIEEAGVTGVSVWAESHAAIHTWDDENYFAFDAFSCKNFDPVDALRLLLNTFDIERLNCYNILRYQRSPAVFTYYSVDAQWKVYRDDKFIGELDNVDFFEWEIGRDPKTKQ